MPQSGHLVPRVRFLARLNADCGRRVKPDVGGLGICGFRLEVVVDLGDLLFNLVRHRFFHRLLKLIAECLGHDLDLVISSRFKFRDLGRDFLRLGFRRWGNYERIRLLNLVCDDFGLGLDFVELGRH